MINDNLHEPFQIVLKELLDECPRTEHRHSFFELVYIVCGSGKQCINQTKIPYSPGHLFFLTPEDSHYFKIEIPTQFLFIRFNKSYLKQDNAERESITRLELTLKNARHEPRCIITKETDRTIVKSIMEAIIVEHYNDDLFHKDLIRQYINTLLVIVVRNISLDYPEVINESSEERAIRKLTNVAHFSLQDLNGREI